MLSDDHVFLATTIVTVSASLELVSSLIVILTTDPTVSPKYITLFANIDDAAADTVPPNHH